MTAIRNLILMSLLSGIIFHSCEDYDKSIISPADIPAVIAASLNTVSDSQYVLLSTIQFKRSTSEQVINREFQLLERAQIMLKSDDLEFSFPVHYQYYDSVHGGTKLVWSSPHPVFPTQTYQLQVAIPEKGTFHAQTTLPGDFEILMPNPVDTLDVYKPLQVKWTAAAGAAGYRVVLWDHVLDSTFFVWNGQPIINSWGPRSVDIIGANDSLNLTIKHFLEEFYHPSDFFFATLLETRLTIEALDEVAWLSREINQNTYLHQPEFRIEPFAYSNFDRGYGIFCAITTKIVPIPIPGGQK